MNEELLQMLMKMGGAAGGGGLSSLLGASGGGGIGSLLGAGGSEALSLGGMAVPGLPLAVGGIELISGLMKGNKANQAKEALNAPDPEMDKYMSEIDRQRKSFETGSGYAQEIKQLKNQQSATQEGVLRAAKGNTGSALAAIEQVGLNTGMGYGKIAAQGQERQDKYSEMYGGLVQKMNDRKYAQNMDEYNQANIDARDSKIKGLQTLLNTAGLAGKSSGFGQSQNLLSILQKLMATKGQQSGSFEPTTETGYESQNPNIMNLPLGMGNPAYNNVA